MSPEAPNAATADDVLPWMPLWVGDFLVEVMALNQEQIGALTLLMCAYWMNRGPLPDDDDHLASITRSAPAQWKKLKPRLLRHFTVEAGYWRHSRLDGHLSDARLRHEKAKKRARAGAQARWARPEIDSTVDASSIPDALPVHCPSPSPPPDQRRGGADLEEISAVASLRDAQQLPRDGTTEQGAKPPAPPSLGRPVLVKGGKATAKQPPGGKDPSKAGATGHSQPSFISEYEPIAVRFGLGTFAEAAARGMSEGEYAHAAIRAKKKHDASPARGGN